MATDDEKRKSLRGTARANSTTQRLNELQNELSGAGLGFRPSARRNKPDPVVRNETSEQRTRRQRDTGPVQTSGSASLISSVERRPPARAKATEEARKEAQEGGTLDVPLLDRGTAGTAPSSGLPQIEGKEVAGVSGALLPSETLSYGGAPRRLGLTASTPFASIARGQSRKRARGPSGATFYWDDGGETGGTGKEGGFGGITTDAEGNRRDETGALYFDNKDAKERGFQGTVLDTDAFRKQAAALYKARGLNPDGTKPEEFENPNADVLRSLRERVKRGGAGSLKAAAALANLQSTTNQAREAFNARTGDGLSAGDQIKLARLEFDKKKFETEEERRKAENQFENITDYFGSQYADNEEELARRTRLASQLGSRMNSIESAADADIMISALDKFGQDTGFLGFFGDRGPVQDLTAIQDIEFDEDGETVTVTDVDGKTWSNDGFEFWEDFGSRDRALLEKVFNKDR